MWVGLVGLVSAACSLAYRCTGGCGLWVGVRWCGGWAYKHTAAGSEPRPSLVTLLFCLSKNTILAGNPGNVLSGAGGAVSNSPGWPRPMQGPLGAAHRSQRPQGRGAPAVAAGARGGRRLGPPGNRQGVQRLEGSQGGGFCWEATGSGLEEGAVLRCTGGTWCEGPHRSASCAHHGSVRPIPSRLVAKCRRPCSGSMLVPPAACALIWQIRPAHCACGLARTPPTCQDPRPHSRPSLLRTLRRRGGSAPTAAHITSPPPPWP